MLDKNLKRTLKEVCTVKSKRSVQTEEFMESNFDKPTETTSEDHDPNTSYGMQGIEGFAYSPTAHDIDFNMESQRS